MKELEELKLRKTWSLKSDDWDNWLKAVSDPYLQFLQVALNSVQFISLMLILS